jgi:hypothetical protein
MRAMLTALFVAFGACVAAHAAKRNSALALASAEAHHSVFALACSDATHDVAVTFVLPGHDDLMRRYGATPDAVWIDLSLLDNGFAAGSFIGAGPFAIPASGGGGAWDWQHVIRSNLHYYRLNARFGATWREVAAGMFETPTCLFIRDMMCAGDGTSVVRFAIPAATPLAGRSAIGAWVDLTLRSNPVNDLLDDGFPADTFVGAGPFPPTGSAFSWRGILPGLRHHFRLNVLYNTPPGWVTNFSGSFEALDCRGLPDQIQLPL